MSSEKSYFEHQRDALLADISQALENVLTGLNALNRGVEGVVSVGREMEGVETLWSRFETGVLEGREEGEGEAQGQGQGQGGQR